MLALTHIGVLPSLYKSYITLSAYQVFGTVAGENFFLLILTIAQLNITLEFNLFFYFLFFGYISSCNLVFMFMCVTTVKVSVNVCADGVKLNYLCLILNQKQPYTGYIEN